MRLDICIVVDISEKLIENEGILMRKCNRRTALALVLTICLVCCMIPASAFGADYSQGFGQGQSAGYGPGAVYSQGFDYSQSAGYGPGAVYSQSTGSDMVPVHLETVVDYTAANMILELVNEVRREAGLTDLIMDSRLQEGAVTRAKEIAIYFNHTRPDGSSCMTVSQDMAGENIAAGYGSPKAVMDGWMSSPGHRANILREDFTDIGIGCVYYNGVWYWAQSFGRTTGNDKTKSGQVSESIDTSVLKGLIVPVCSTKREIDLGDGKELSDLKVEIFGENTGWEYGKFALDPALFSLKSSDESVIKIDDEGHLTVLKPGTATIHGTLLANPAQTVDQEITIVHNLKEENVKLSRTSYTYSGKAKRPKVTIEGLSEDEDFVVAYKDNVKVGTASVIVIGIGNVHGVVEKTFKIDYDRPDKVSQSKLKTTDKNHALTVNWKKVGCDGYQIRYSTSKTFKTYRTVYVKKGSTVSKTIKGLTKGKRYYVKVRAYNWYDDTRVYGKFSNVRYLKCK